MERTPRLTEFQKLLRKKKIVNRQIVQQELFARDTDGSPTREFLRKAVAAGLAQRFRPANEFAVAVAPCYFPTEAGCCQLATHLDDMSWLLDAEPRVHPQNVPHALGVTRLMLDLDKALAGQSYVEVPEVYREQDVIGPLEVEPARRYRLYSVVAESPKTVVCVPDLATLVRVGRFARAYCWEYETGADGSPTRVANRKAGGYFGLNKSGLFRRFFTGGDVADARVVAVCPGRGFRESLRKAVATKPGSELWLFVDRNDLTPATLLHAPIFHTCQGDGPRPLIKPPAPPPVSPAKE